MKIRSFLALFFLLASSASAGVFPGSAPATTNNNDSCDIGVFPAATLLLPEFEIETNGHTFDTIFTITNVSRLPQIARVTIWTDWGYPVLTFNVFLTGYDVQPLSLYDIVVNGLIAPSNGALTAGGTSSTTTPGLLSAGNSSNPNISTAACSNLPGFVPPPIRDAVMRALTKGLYTGFPGAGCGNVQIGQPAAAHPTSTAAVGFVTIDVVAACTADQPIDPHYFDQQLLFDNVLTGDYQIVYAAQGSAVGGPLVHIRAIPEGGAAGGAQTTSLPYTFYEALTPAASPHIDRRQPLPAVFAARWRTEADYLHSSDITMWRGWATNANSPCDAYTSNGLQQVMELVRFDEHENPNMLSSGCVITCVPTVLTLPSTARVPSGSSVYPPAVFVSADKAGWMYINASAAGKYPSGPAYRVQNWVTYTLRSGPFAVESTATALGNGCSPLVMPSTASGGTTIIGPLPHTNP